MKLTVTCKDSAIIILISAAWLNSCLLAKTIQSSAIFHGMDTWSCHVKFLNVHREGRQTQAHFPAGFLNCSSLGFVTFTFCLGFRGYRVNVLKWEKTREKPNSPKQTVSVFMLCGGFPESQAQQVSQNIFPKAARGIRGIFLLASLSLERSLGGSPCSGRFWSQWSWDSRNQFLLQRDSPVLLFSCGNG